MVENPIIMDKISNRRICQQKEGDNNDNISYWFELANSSIDSIDSNKSRNIKRCFMECTDKTVANKWYPKYIKLLESLSSNDSSLSKQTFSECLQLFKSRIVPFVSNMNELCEKISISDIEDGYKSGVIKEADEYKVCDRILSNHDKLSKRFNLSNYIYERRKAPLDELVYEVCSMIDTYDSIPTYGKMNIALEELSYLLTKNAIYYNDKVFIESVVDYFLSRETNSHTDLTIGYSRVLSESSVVSKDELDNVKFLLYGASTNNRIMDSINEYKLTENKGDKLFLETLYDIFNNSEEQDLLENANGILKWVKNFLALPTSDVKSINEAIDFITERYIDMGLNRKYVGKLLNEFAMEKDNINSRISHSTNNSILLNLETYFGCLENSINEFSAYRQNLYTDEEAAKIYNLNEYSRFISLENFTEFEFNTLLNDSNTVYNNIKKNSKNIENKTKAKVTSLKDINESSSMEVSYPERYISEDGEVDICAAVLDTSEVTNLDEFHNYFTALCNSMENYTSSRVYYTVLENTCEIRIKPNYKVCIDEVCDKMVFTDAYKVDQLIQLAEAMEELDKIDFSNIMADIENKLDYVTADQVDLFLDFWACNSIVPTEEMTKFVNKFCKYKEDQGCIMESSRIKYKFECLNVLKDPELDIYTESAKLMREVISEGVNLNSIKLAMQGLKKKAKDFGTKEQQASRNLDMHVNNLVRGAKSFLVSDRREAIIKGSVIPSFSKIMKIGIALAGVAKFLHPALAAIALIGGLAASKNLTRKERSLLLDEIDIELQVVDRELKRLEDDGQSAQAYRSLLTYQKNLMREKQRIKYNLSLAGKALPSANMKGED